MTDGERTLDLIAEQQHGLITREQARRLGVDGSCIARRMRQGRWDRVGRSVYRLSGSPKTAAQTLMAAVLGAGPQTVAARESAAALSRLPGFRLVPPQMLRPQGRDAEDRRPGLRLTCWLPASHITVVDAIPTTTAVRTAFDLCGAIHPKRAERALDNGLAMKLFTVDQCTALVHDLCKSGRAGSTLFRELVEARGGGYVAPESELEARFIDLAVAAGFDRPVRQLNLGDDAGFIGRVDFAWPSARLIVEVDGRRWHGAKLDRDADEQRHNRLTAAGWHVLRISWDQLTRRPHEVVALLSAFLNRAA
ncbi:MAG: Protein of unknown function (DUF559)/Domain of unknown function [Acidimicrobiales bacterium]|jgi:hypothetical protein|nr:Protein of unknown function (DUF559)/Domain of unknown function [Acidimicrobiales bacterium]